MKRALISVFDKNGILDFSKFLIENGVEIISTGGTYKHLRENGVTVTEINEVTNFPEMLDRRVKTLHPIIHAGILAIRNNEEHIKTIKEKKLTNEWQNNKQKGHNSFFKWRWKLIKYSYRKHRDIYKYHNQGGKK